MYEIAHCWQIVGTALKQCTCEELKDEQQIHI